ncbi:MAG: SPOR domain-containing protein [Burkholderiaceae bacterium]|nr:SPOR domain-containing protein [Burkholderiaceae bacterium]
MGLLSIFKRNSEGREAPAAKPVTDAADAVQQLRVRARRRLIGAAVLVAIGIIGFPLVFETQPRPIPVDLPIEIPRKEAAAPLPMPAAPQPVASEAIAKPAIITETRDGEEAPLVAKSEPAAPTVEKAASKPAPKLADKVADKVADKAVEKAKPAEAARVQALLEGKAAASAADKKASDAAGRFIVQVGAFGEANAAREARLKVEKLGLKTYTQVIESAEGKRTRVRVGPFATREEADKASGRIRAAGLPAAILTL